MSHSPTLPRYSVTKRNVRPCRESRTTRPASHGLKSICKSATSHRSEQDEPSEEDCACEEMEIRKRVEGGFEMGKSQEGLGCWGEGGSVIFWLV